VTDHPPLKRIKSVHHAAYRCRDAEQTRWFYETVLGLKAAAGLIIEVTPGSGADDPYMHIFFAMPNGDYVAFFDAPGSAKAEWFERKHGFDMHLAFEVDTEAEMLAMRDRLKSYGIAAMGPIDHHFVKSIYMYDPNGIQVEITIRTAEHDPILAHEGAILEEQLAAWNVRMRELKLKKFGAEALALRGDPVRA
jgi:catechol 2,3-dioxygenase-like lactoylglutathione lyase family enzyme